MKRKSLLLLLVLTFVVTLSLGLFTACKDDDGVQPPSISNEAGFKVEGYEFEEGTELVASKIDSEGADGKSVISAISGESYDTTKPVYIFDISLVKGEIKVQPSGKVKVSVPVSADLTGYDVLHIRVDGKIERLSVKYSKGFATFETDGFSKFVFVKKISSGSDSGSSGSSGTQHTFLAKARRVVPSTKQGGYVTDANGETITYSNISLDKGSRYTVSANCNFDYYFFGWYYASELEEATEETFISKESTYTFTMNRDMTVCALFAYKDDVVEVAIEARYAEFSYRNDEPVTTLVLKGCDEKDRPNPDNVSTSAITAGGSSTLNSSGVLCDLGGLDFNKAGTYTISYYHEQNPLAKATLTVRVVDVGYDLNVSVKGYIFRYNYNELADLNSDRTAFVYNSKMPQGRLVTLSAITQGTTYNQMFKGWYSGSTLLCKDFVYAFEMPAKSLSISAEWESVPYCKLEVDCDGGGTIVDDLGNTFIERDYSTFEPKLTTLAYESGSKVHFTAKPYERYDFIGWYETDGYTENLISSNEELNYTITTANKIYPKFYERMLSIELYESEIDEKIIDGKISYAIGDTVPDYKNFALRGAGITGFKIDFTSDDYVVLGEVDFTKAGTYTVTYAYAKNQDVTTSITFAVVNPQALQIVYNQYRSQLEHEFNGKAVFISRQDITVNGLPLISFKDISKIWQSITYKWIDKSTGEQVDVTDVDVTVNGVVNEYFGPENDKQVVGNEFCGPIKAGEYKFELSVDGVVVLSKDAKITASNFKKITTKEEFKTNEGSTWVNYELYYYTIVGEVDGELYVMQLPSIGAESVEVEARKVTPDADGKITLGGGNDFVFVNAKYYANYVDQYTEFLTGYYGSYVVLSSDNASVGSFGTPLIYRTCYTSVSGGHIYREYGTKYPYGNKTEFDENGAVTIYSPNNGETANTRLRLVKDGDKFVFTSVPEDTDTRTSYSVYIYQSILNT